MAKFRSQKNSFIAGELSPTALGRLDLPQYPHSCELIRNAIPLLSGGVYRRPGTLYDSELDATTDYAPRLLPFIVSKDESYLIIISKVVGGNGYAKYVRVSDNISSGSSGLATGTLPYSPSTLSTLSTVGWFDEWHALQYTQSADVMTLVHPKHKPMRLYRTAANTFVAAEFDQDSTGAYLAGTARRDAWPYFAQNSTATTLQINIATVGTGRVLTASANLFNANHVGGMFKVDNGGTIGSCVVTGYTNATTVTVEVITAFGAAATPVATWWESAWSDYRGWPGSVNYYQSRIGYFGTKYSPDSCWFSQTSNYDVMSVASLGDPISGPSGTQPFTLELSTNQVNRIKWSSAEKTLLLGTAADEILLKDIDPSVGFAATNVSVEVQSHHGSSAYQAVRAGKELIFCKANEDELRSFIFDEVEEAYADEAIQLLYDEYPKAASGFKRFRSFAWDPGRNTLWCNDVAGNLFGMTRDRRVGVTMWHSHEFGGYDSGVTGGSVGAGATLTMDPAYSACAGSVISLAVVPNPLLGADDVWVAVKRKINGNWKYMIERMIGKGMPLSSAYDQSANVAQHPLCYVDSAVYSASDYPGAEDYTFTVSHLEGIAPDGTAFGTRGIFHVTGSAVSSGSTVLGSPYPPNIASETYIVILGLGYETIIRPVRLEAGSQIGTAQGAIKRIHSLDVRFWKTLSAKVGSSSGNIEELIFLLASTPMGYGPELFTGDKHVLLDADYDRDGYIYLLQDKALPFAIISLSAEGMTYDG